MLRAFSQADGSENAVYASFRKKKEADLAQEHASMALMKWYSAVYKITGSVLMLAAVLLLGGVFERIPLSVLAVILIVTMWEKLDFQALKTVFGGKKPIQIILFFLCAAATVFFELPYVMLLFAVVTICSALRMRKKR